MSNKPKLTICYYGNPILRKRCDEVKEVTDEVRALALEMIEAMDRYNGMGLAAPQVGVPIRLFVIYNHTVDEEGYVQLTKPQVFINPKILSTSEELDEMTEGCLSLPGIREHVIRPYKITVEALDLYGNLFTETREGLDARVVLHENDHINGVLYIDRLDKALRKELEPTLKKIKKKYQKN